MNVIRTILILISFAILVCANNDFTKEEGVKAERASVVSVTSELKDGEARCAYLCPGGQWCCSYNAPICAGNGYCCPYDRPTLWGTNCY